MKTICKCLECRQLYDMEQGWNEEYCSEWCADAAYVASLADRKYQELKDSLLTAQV